MASFVINGFATFDRPLSDRQLAILYYTAAWSMGMLDDDTMTTDGVYWIIRHPQFWGR